MSDSRISENKKVERVSSRRKLQYFYNVIWKVTYFLFSLIVLVLRPTLIIYWRNYTKMWISAECHWGANLKAKIRTVAMVLGHRVRKWWHGSEDWEKKTKLWDIYKKKIFNSEFDNIKMSRAKRGLQGFKLGFLVIWLPIDYWVEVVVVKNETEDLLSFTWHLSA